MKRAALCVAVIACHRAPAPAPATPSPSPSAPRNAWRELVPYLVANLWPHAVTPKGDDAFTHVAPDEEVTADPAAVQYHLATCIGPIYKGQHLIAAPDPALIALGCELAKTDQVEARGIAYFRALAKSAEFAALVSVADHLREQMVAKLVADPAVKAEACARFAARITDC